MNKGSLYARGFRHIRPSAFRYRWIKNAFADPKSSGALQKWGPWTLWGSMILYFPLFYTRVGKHPKATGPDYERYSVVSLHFVLVRLLMVSSNIAVCSTVFSYCHNCSIAQGNRTKRLFNSGAPARRRRANTAPFFRKFRKPIKPRKFGYDVTVRASERTASVQTLGEGAGRLTREFKQITTAGATTAAVPEKVWGEYVFVVCQ